MTPNQEAMAAERQLRAAAESRGDAEAVHFHDRNLARLMERERDALVATPRVLHPAR